MNHEMPDKDGTHCKMQQSSGDHESLVLHAKPEKGSKSIPLTELLDKIPLAYSPFTKQLHIIYPKQDNSASQTQDHTKTFCMSNDDPKHLPETSDNVIDQINNAEEEVDCNGPSVVRKDCSELLEAASETGEEESSVTQQCEDGSSEDSLKPKKRSISNFFSRNVFSWKTKEHTPSPGHSSSSHTWRIFHKSAQDVPNEIVEDDEGNISSCTSLNPYDSPTSVRSLSNKRYEDLIASSSALILHQRPSNLPAKSVDEETKHRHEYEQIVEAAKKKERQETKVKKKQLQQQIKTEERLASATKVWVNEILPKWSTVQNCRKTRNMWWQGIPPGVRGKVWQLAIGNELNLTQQLYEICVARAQELLRAKSNCGNSEPQGEESNPDRQASVELIQLDISRTFPQLCIFQKGGPYYDILHSLLGAYACYRPDVGYVQGMSFLAAILILNMEEAEAFVCFANLLNRPCHMAFFRLEQSMMQAYYTVFEQLMAENLPKLFFHFTKSHLTPDLYLLDWIYTVFAKAMPLDVACRVWDVFLRDGEEFLFRAALGVLHLYQGQLLGFDFLAGSQLLTKLPDELNADNLFHSIHGIRMQRYGELLSAAWSPSSFSTNSSHCSTTNNSGSTTPVTMS